MIGKLLRDGMQCNVPAIRRIRNTRDGVSGIGDTIHVATMLNSGIGKVVSVDKHFDVIEVSEFIDLLKEHRENL